LWKVGNLDWSQSRVALGCVSLVLGYLVAKLGGSLILRSHTIWPLWPGNAFLATLLLLAPRKRWPIILTSGFARFALYDLSLGVRIRSIVLLILADLIEVLTAAVGIRYSFDGVPRLDSVKSLAKYSVFGVILAPISVTFVGAIALQGDYWTSWRISFFSEALAFLTVTPAILSWFSDGSVWLRKSRANQLEGTALIAGLTLLGYFTFVAFGRHSPPGLLYSFVPFLLWAALRFGSLGISTSVIVVSFLSVWGAVHGRGPFAAD